MTWLLVLGLAQIQGLYTQPISQGILPACREEGHLLSESFSKLYEDYATYYCTVPSLTIPTSSREYSETVIHSHM